MELYHTFLFLFHELPHGRVWKHTLSTLHSLCQRGLRCWHHCQGCLGCGHHCQGGQGCGVHHCSPSPTTSIRSNLTTFRYKDVWISWASQHCHAGDPLLDCGCPTGCNIKRRDKENRPRHPDADIAPLTPHLIGAWCWCHQGYKDSPSPNTLWPRWRWGQDSCRIPHQAGCNDSLKRYKML